MTFSALDFITFKTRAFLENELRVKTNLMFQANSGVTYVKYIDDGIAYNSHDLEILMNILGDHEGFLVDAPTLPEQTTPYSITITVDPDFDAAAALAAREAAAAQPPLVSDPSQSPNAPL